MTPNMPSDSQNEPPARGRSRASLATHPLLPALIALWLAALLSIGAMVTPASLMERAAGAVHLDQLVPAARPPLGLTARLLVAFALALTGAAGGYLAARALGRRAVRPAVPEARVFRRPEAAVAAVPGDDEDFARLAAARPEVPPRRRALTSETTESAAAPSILDISALPALSPLAEDASPVTPPAATGEDTAPEPAPATPEDAAEQTVRFRGPAELVGTAAIHLCAAPLENLGVIQLVERFALALHARRHRDGTAPNRPDGQPRPAPFGEPQDSPPRPAGPANRRFGMPAEPAGHAAAAPLASAAGSPPLTRHPALPATPGGAMAAPAPVGEGEDIDEDLARAPGDTSYSSLLDLRPATRVPPPLADFVRVEDGKEEPAVEAGPRPVVVFPGQAMPAAPLPTRLPGMDEPASAAQTEAALREALAALQRMSGAA